MKKLTLVASICFLFFLNGCFFNPYTKALEDIRSQNIEGVFTAYETAFKGIHVDYIENAAEQYRKDRENDLLLSGYQSVSGKTPDEIKQTPLFSVGDILEVDKIYQERTQRRIKEINDSFAKFEAVVGGAKITIQSVEQKVELLRQQRERTIQEATATGLATAAGVATGAVIVH